MREIKDQSCSIVIRGDFNPRIFQPSWFAMQNLLGPDEAQNAKLDVIHPDVAHFATDWADVQILRDRFAVRTLQDGHESAIRDLVLGTFKLLKHTPAGVMGINKIAHFSVDSIDDWHAIGHAIVPKIGLWNEVLKEPGTREVIVHGKRPDEFSGYVSIKIEPSPVIQPGVMIEINDHFDVKANEKTVTPAVAELMRTLENVWASSLVRADAAIKRIMEIK